MAEATITKLRPEIIELIRTTQKLKNRILYEIEMSEATLYRLLKTNSEKLTQAGTLRIISEELDIPKDELLTE